MTVLYVTRERGVGTILTGTKAYTFTHEHPLVKLQLGEWDGRPRWEFSCALLTAQV